MTSRSFPLASLAALALLLAGCEDTASTTAAETRSAAARALALAPRPVADNKTPEGEPQEFKSRYLDQPLILWPGVFPANEAENQVLPFMDAHRQLFQGQRVFEIGTGSGILSLYAAQLGAAKVVCSDISAEAIDNVRRNAERMGRAAAIDARLVPETDISAYSVIRDDEVFDTIISNAPYALDLDADYNTALVDKGDLGLSIVRGLARHLTPDGAAVLLYNTLFYHNVIVKFARYSGYQVRSHIPLGEAPWALEPLYNHYLHRLLKREGIPRDAFRFYKEELPFTVNVVKRDQPPLFGDGEKAARLYPGFVVIRHAEKE